MLMPLELHRTPTWQPPDLELIQQYAQAIQATGLLEEDTVNGITAMVDQAREQFRVADEQGIPPETLQLLPDDQRAAMQEVLMQVQRIYGSVQRTIGPSRLWHRHTT